MSPNLWLSPAAGFFFPPPTADQPMTPDGLTPRTRTRLDRELRRLDNEIAELRGRLDTAIRQRDAVRAVLVDDLPTPDADVPHVIDGG